jgi:hypothetical protein
MNSDMATNLYHLLTRTKKRFETSVALRGTMMSFPVYTAKLFKTLSQDSNEILMFISVAVIFELK